VHSHRLAWCAPVCVGFGHLALVNRSAVNTWSRVRPTVTGLGLGTLLTAFSISFSSPRYIGSSSFSPQSQDKHQDMAILRYQPFKTLYVVYAVCTVVFLRLPIWFITAIPPSCRPRRSWSITRVLWVKVLKQVYALLRK
jgi:hypothetical protein